MCGLNSIDPLFMKNALTVRNYRFTYSHIKSLCVSFPLPSPEGDKNTLPPTSTSLTSNTSKKRLPVKALKEWRESIEVPPACSNTSLL